jgi:hypothetical protein
VKGSLVSKEWFHGHNEQLTELTNTIANEFNIMIHSTISNSFLGYTPQDSDSHHRTHRTILCDLKGIAMRGSHVRGLATVTIVVESDQAMLSFSCEGMKSE